VAETTVYKDLYAADFDALVKRWENYRCWWRICREINVFFFQVRISYILRFISICDVFNCLSLLLRESCEPYICIVNLIKF
jgi:hypothetical protein